MSNKICISECFFFVSMFFLKQLVFCLGEVSFSPNCDTICKYLVKICWRCLRMGCTLSSSMYLFTRDIKVEVWVTSSSFLLRFRVSTVFSRKKLG